MIHFITRTQTDPKFEYLQKNATSIKVSALSVGLLLIGGAIACYFLHVNSVGTYAIGGLGSLCAGDALLAFVIQSLKHQRVKSESWPTPETSLPLFIDKMTHYDGRRIRQSLLDWANQAPLFMRESYVESAFLIQDCLDTQSTSLDLSKKDLSSLPEAFQLLTHLETLNLSSNQLKSIPESIWNLTCLKELNFSGNELRSIPERIGQLTSLRGLYFFHNLIESVPDSIGQLIHLEVLHFSTNQLESIPDSIRNLTCLKKMVFSSNRITSIPESIGQLTNLNSLNFYGNQIASIPSSICNLTCLTNLNFSHNHLISLPNEILHLPPSATVSIERNPLSRQVLSHLGAEITRSDYSGPRVFYSMPEHINTSALSLEELLSEFFEAAESSPFALENLIQDDEKKENLQIWLSRLASIGDYKTKRKELAKLIYRAIEKAENEADFKETFWNCIQDASSTCGDRMALSVIYLDIQFRIAESEKNLDLGELAYLMGHGSKALSMLEQIASEKTLTLKFVDEIEVYLAYPIKLKEELSLPIPLDTMLYFACSSVTDEDLKNASEMVKSFLSNEESYYDYLVSDPKWQKALEKVMPGACGEIKKKKDVALESAQSTQEYETVNAELIENLISLTKEVLQKIERPDNRDFLFRRYKKT